MTYAVTLPGTAGCTVASGVLSAASAGSCTVTATKAADTNYTAVSSSATQVSFAKAAQATLTLSTVSGTYGQSLALITTGGTTAGAVTYSASTGTAGGCTVSGSSLSVTSAGTCTVTATMAGDGNYDPVSSAATTVTFAKAAQAALTLTSISGTFGTALTLTTSGGTTAGSVSYAVADGTASTCAVSSGALTSSSFGTCVVTATMAGNGNYEPVSSSATTVTLAKRQITIASDDKAIVYGSTVSPSYTLASGSLASGDAISGVTYTYAGTGVTTYGPSTTAPTGGGTYSSTPSAAVFSSGSAGNYTISYTAGSITIGRASQSITFAQPAGATYLDAPFALGGSASSGLTVAYASSTTDVCTVAGGIVTIVGAGDCTITASQAGNANYNAAADVTQTFTVARAAQAALSMTSASSAVYGQTITLAASGGSGTGALSFSVTSPAGVGRCSLNGTTLTLGNAGSVCKVQATKAQDANYLLTTSAEQTITISQAGQTLAFTSTVPTAPLPNDTYSPAASSISTVTGSASGVVPTFTVAGACTIAGGVVTFTVTGNCTVTASGASNTNFTAAAAVTQVIAVGSLNQTITFAQPSNVAFGSSGFAANGSASSGLTVTYALGAGTTNGACSVSTLGAVSILAVGTCEIVASQAGDAQYAPASDVTRAFQVEPALATAPSLTSASASSQAITVGFTTPGFTGGVPITAYRLVATPTGSGITVTTTACTSSPCTITGLENGTEYRVTVAAINAAGTGPASGASTPLTPATSAYAVGALSATPGDTTVTLAWTPLTTAQLGGGTFTRYEIAKRVAGTSAWTTVTTALTNRLTATYTITGLSNGTSYDFQIVAITSANASEIPGNTAEVVQYPSTAPSAPRSPSVLASTATDVLFSWEAPLSDGGSALTSPNYTVTVTTTSAGAAAATCTPAPTARSCTASNLTNGAVYVFSVVAKNRMGASPAATVTYNVPSADATLADLEITGAAGVVALSPAFASGTTGYTAAVTYGVPTVTVTPTTTTAGSTVTVDGVAVTSGTASEPIALAVGITAIEVVVTASDPRYTETYTVSITRAAAPSNGGGGGVAPGIPVTPPAVVLSGTTLGAVTQDGEVRGDVALVRNASDSGWTVIAEDFTLSAATRSATGAVVPLAPNGVMQVTQGGVIVVSGAGYAPSSEVAVFAIPRTPTAAAGRVKARVLSTAIYLASVPVDVEGRLAGSVPLPSALAVGDYVLQMNGVSTTEALRSVNLLLNVDPATQAKAGSVMRSAFFDAQSARISTDGKLKVQALATAIPRNATSVKVSVVAVSVSLGSPEANLSLARERAVAMVKELRARGIAGEYTVSVSTTFTVDAAERQAADQSASQRERGKPSPRTLGMDAKPVVDASGKPLTTVSITYVAPAESV